jgi:hypothetical protein
VKNREVSLAVKLATVDQVADAALQPAEQSRYLAFRNALIADGQQDEQILQTLWLFLWNLADGRSVNGVH